MRDRIKKERFAHFCAVKRVLPPPPTQHTRKNRVHTPKGHNATAEKQYFCYRLPWMVLLLRHLISKGSAHIRKPKGRGYFQGKRLDEEMPKGRPPESSCLSGGFHIKGCRKEPKDRVLHGPEDKPKGKTFFEGMMESDFWGGQWQYASQPSKKRAAQPSAKPTHCLHRQCAFHKGG